MLSPSEGSRNILVCWGWMFTLYLGRRGEGKEGRVGAGGNLCSSPFKEKLLFLGSYPHCSGLTALPKQQWSSELIATVASLDFHQDLAVGEESLLLPSLLLLYKKENVPSVSCPPNSQAPPSPFGCINLVTVYFFLRPGTNYVLGGWPSEGTAPWTAVIQVTFSRTHLCTLSIFSSSFFRVSSVSFICSDP